jgi:ATP-binding cassette subfamily C protein
MFDFLDMKDEKQEGKNIQIVDDWNIEFKNVSFHYPGSEKYIYKHLNFTIQKGKKIAVIGLNGVGKTTMMKLLMRLYEPTNGEILLNGVNIKEYALNEYYDLFAPVFQEINLFPYSMKDNLVFGDEIEEKVARDIFKQVGLDKKLSDYSMDQMMTKYLDEDGLLLSGGESQKFVMARAVCSKHPILILDEPTSALDAIAEYEFYDKINHEYKDKTILFISHRLASTSFCDEIILVDDQNISEYGTHEELMKRKGKYYDLYQIQSKYYREEVEV